MSESKKYEVLFKKAVLRKKKEIITIEKRHQQKCRSGRTNRCEGILQQFIMSFIVTFFFDV